MMDPDSVVDTKWRNQALTDMLGPGHKVLWPGPVVIFSYGYDISDYVKVDPNGPDAGVSGAEADMTQHEIWRELDTLR